MIRNSKRVQLPQNFADKLLDCQIQYRLNPKPSQAILKQLIQLYTIGFQYYESIRSHKFLYFSQKMKEVFKYVDSQTHKISQKQKSQRQQQFVGSQELRNKKDQFNYQFSNNIKSEVCVDSVKKIIDKAKLGLFQVKKMTQIELQKQNCNLLQKIQQRKQKASFRKSFSTVTGLTSDLSSQSSLDLDSSPMKQKINQKQFYFTDIINENQGDENLEQKSKKQLQQQCPKNTNDFLF